MTLTPREIRALQLNRELAQDNLERELAEYHKYVDALIYTNETLVEENVLIPNWQKYSEILLIKFCNHGLSALSLFKGLVLKSEYYDEELSGKFIMDKASIKVILRAQLETFLMYHYIYVNVPDDDLKRLRYLAWVYSGLIQRQKFPAKTEFGKAQLQKDKTALIQFAKDIQSLQSFEKLTANQQKSLIENGSGKLFKRWSDIFSETGFGENHIFSIMYNFWSMYAHSEGVSAIQLSSEALKYNSKDPDAFSDLHSMKMLVCSMIIVLIEKYKVAKNRYESLPENLRYDIEFYNELIQVAKY